MLILKPWNIAFIMFMIIGLVRSGMSPGGGFGAVGLAGRRALSMKLMVSVEVAPLRVSLKRTGSSELGSADRVRSPVPPLMFGGSWLT